MATGNEKLYVSQGGAGKSTITASEIAQLASTEFVLPAPSAEERGGVFTGPGITPSASTVASAAPAGGTGTAAGGWDTPINRDAAIATLNQTRTLALELQTKFNALVSSLEGNGIIA
jgi:hypothetical protein